MSDIRNPRLEKVRNGVWEIRWSEKRANRYVTKSLSTRTTDRREAESVFTGFLDGVDNTAKVMSTPTVSAICAAYESALEAYKTSETQHICLRHIVRELGHFHIADLTPDRLLTYRKSRGVMDGTLRRELQTLVAAVNYGVRHKLLKTEDVPLIDLPRPSAPRRVYLNDQEERDFYQLALAQSGQRLERISIFVALALDTAARRDAIVSLTWDRVDFHASTIDYNEPGMAQTNKRRALVPISKRLRPILERAYQERTNEFVLFSDADIRPQWERWIKTTQFQHIHPHDLRRTFATLNIQAGVPLVNVAAILGDDVKTVLIHYGHFVPGNAQAAVDARHK